MLEGTDSLADATHLIIDEVHERSIDSDFLLIVLKEILEVRKDLKFVRALPSYLRLLTVLHVQGHSHVRHGRVSYFSIDSGETR